MSDYSAIKGSKIQSLSSDPSDPYEGQIWYNSTTGEFKEYDVYSTGVWSTGATMGVFRSLMTQTGSQTSAISMTGGTPSNSYDTISQSWNGSAWTTTASMNTGRSTAGSAGASSTSAIAIGGDVGPINVTGTEYITETESWNGTAWTVVNPLAEGGYAMGCVGTQTDAISFNSRWNPPTQPPTVGYNTNTQSWNGTSWTVIPATQSVSRSWRGAAGTSTSALSFSDFNGNVESYNGTAWTAAANVNNARNYAGGGGASNSDAMTFGGGNPPASIAYYDSTEVYNGTSFSTANPLIVATASISQVNSGPTSAGVLGSGNSDLTSFSRTGYTQLWNGGPIGASVKIDGSF